jgi:hypothetical protein
MNELMVFPVNSLARGLHTFIVDQELVQTTARRHHGKDRDLAVSNDLQEGRAIVLNQPLQLLLKFRGLEARIGADAHSLSKGNEVGVLLVSVRVPILVEEVLPGTEKVSQIYPEDQTRQLTIE